MIYSDKFGKDYEITDSLFVKCQPSVWKSFSSDAYSKYLKRIFDVVLTLLMILPALIIIVPFALLISLDGHSPFYVQRRLGKGGRVFAMIKLRSMCANAENRLQNYLNSDPERQSEWEKSQKLRDDPRITLIGNFIRRTSIDELPQLFNVLAGHMSLVGPRPMMEEQRSLYGAGEYFLMRPGITGSWQVSERNDVDFAERARFDTSYYQRISFWHDVVLLLKTAKVVVAARGR
ncbi:sugar transferase [Lentibacter algarum]|uniref:sugar transferase n=1 Tax=Lentibacter algarum TaxID=576131 RepID=UPI001C09BCB2|nr:sugar transferase [Lentibacter algarum]MBU2982675.1 sugar transferase [Lentibacter algarum]